MVDAVMRGLVTLVLFVPTVAAALGAAAPFTPPRAGAAAAAATVTGDSAAVVAVGGLAGLRLGREPMALIDGAWLRAGATVRGARLAAIDARGVWLLHADGQRERLWLAAPPAPESLASPSR